MSYGWTKEHTLESTGQTGNYWHPINLNYDMMAGTVIFTFGLWISAQHKADGKLPIHVETEAIGENANPELAHGGKTYLVGYVTQLPRFAGSVLDE